MLKSVYRIWQPLSPTGASPRERHRAKAPLHMLQSERQAGLAVTGWKSRGRLAAPVAEIRDVAYHRSRACRFGPDEHL